MSSALDGVSFKLVNSVAAAGEFMTWASQRLAGPLACDTETSGLQPHGPAKDVCRLIQVGDGMTGWAFPYHLWGGVAIELLSKYDGRVVFHNAKYDMGFVNVDHPAVRWGQVDDTRTVAWLEDPQNVTGLKPLAGRYVDSLAPALQSRLDEGMTLNKWTWATVPVDYEPYWVYAAMDTVLTSRMWELLSDRVFRDPGLRAAYDLELSVLPVLQAMEARGARVDTGYARVKSDEYTRWVAGAQAWATTAHGISLTSNQQVVRRLQELGQPLTKMTKGGSYSIDKEVVHDLMLDGVTEEVRQLAKMKRVTGQLTKLCGGYLDKIAVSGGSIHSSINPLGAGKTSRMSVSQIRSDPEHSLALQTLPRADSDNPGAVSVRDCFIPSEGCMLMMCDFDQIELRLMGHFSADPTLVAILSDLTLDPFTEMGREIYGDPSLTKKDPRRQLTKNATYADAYGAGDAQFARTANVPLEQAVSFRRAYHQRFPMIKSFQRGVQNEGERRLREDGAAAVRTPYGHRLVCEPDKVYKLINYLIQGTAANVMKQKLVDLDAAGLGPFMVMPVHDEVVFDVPEDMAAQVGQAAAEIMSERELFAVPLPVGVDGPYERWGEKYR